jgi:PAS domain-containing protein
MTMPARSELLLHLVIDSIPQRVFWKSRDFVYLGCNRSFARDAGLDDPALIVGKADLELAWKATAHLYVADDRLVMESNTAKVDIEEPMTFTDEQVPAPRRKRRGRWRSRNVRGHYGAQASRGSSREK